MPRTRKNVPTNLAQIIRDLDLNVPIGRFEPDGQGGYTLYLYGGRVTRWPPRNKDPGDDPSAPKGRHRFINDDFRTIKGIGGKTYKILVQSGIQTFDQLRRLDEATLSDIPDLSPAAINAILTWQN